MTALFAPHVPAGSHQIGLGDFAEFLALDQPRSPPPAVPTVSGSPRPGSSAPASPRCPAPPQQQGSGQAAHGPCPCGGTGIGVGVLRPTPDGDQQSSPLRNPLPGHAHLSGWHQGLWPRAHHPAHRLPRQANQKDALHAHGPCPPARPQASGPSGHHGVGALRPGPRPAGFSWPAST
jgi:hypothetical protein